MRHLKRINESTSYEDVKSILKDIEDEGMEMEIEDGCIYYLNLRLTDRPPTARARKGNFITELDDASRAHCKSVNKAIRVYIRPNMNKRGPSGGVNSIDCYDMGGQFDEVIMKDFAVTKEFYSLLDKCMSVITESMMHILNLNKSIKIYSNDLHSLGEIVFTIEFTDNEN